MKKTKRRKNTSQCYASTGIWSLLILISFGIMGCQSRQTEIEGMFDSSFSAVSLPPFARHEVARRANWAETMQSMSRLSDDDQLSGTGLNNVRLKGLNDVVTEDKNQLRVTSDPDYTKNRTHNIKPIGVHPNDLPEYDHRGKTSHQTIWKNFREHQTSRMAQVFNKATESKTGTISVDQKAALATLAGIEAETSYELLLRYIRANYGERILRAISPNYAPLFQSISFEETFLATGTQTATKSFIAKLFGAGLAGEASVTDETEIVFKDGQPLAFDVSYVLNRGKITEELEKWFMSGPREDIFLRGLPMRFYYFPRVSWTQERQHQLSLKTADEDKSISLNWGPKEDKKLSFTFSKPTVFPDAKPAIVGDWYTVYKGGFNNWRPDYRRRNTLERLLRGQQKKFVAPFFISCKEKDPNCAWDRKITIEGPYRFEVLKEPSDVSHEAQELTWTWEELPDQNEDPNHIYAIVMREPAHSGVADESNTHLVPVAFLTPAKQGDSFKLGLRFVTAFTTDKENPQEGVASDDGRRHLLLPREQSCRIKTFEESKVSDSAGQQTTPAGVGM